MEAPSSQNQNPRSENSIFKVVEPVSQTPVSPSEPRNPNEPTIVTSEYTEKPASLQESPYLNKMLEIGEAKDHFEMPLLINEINDFVINEIKRLKLTDTPSSYEKIVNKYLDTLKFGEQTDIYTKVEKIAELMKIDKKMIDAVREKEDIMTSDPTTLSSAQLKRRIQWANQ